MNRTRSHSAVPLRHQSPAASGAASASIADVNQLGIRIFGLKSIPVTNSGRLTAFLACASELQRMPQKFVPLLAEELVGACATLPPREELRVLEALFAFQKTPTWTI